MCFSAEASFATAALLIPVGAVCARTALRSGRDHLALAIAPIVFGVQQLCEGVVWTGLLRGDAGLARGGAIAFLFFALVFWPAWIPFAAARIDSDPTRSRLWIAAAAAALLAGLAAWAPLFGRAEEWLRVDVAGHSVRYEFESAIAFTWMPRIAWQAAYVIVVSVPLAMLESKPLRMFGAAVFVSAVATHVAFSQAFISIWCAFAAVLSGWLFVYFRKMARRATGAASAGGRALA